MKRLLYIAFKDFSNLHFGANAKVLAQCSAFSQYGYDVELIGRNGSDTVLIQQEQQRSIGVHRRNRIKNKRFQSLFGKLNQYSDIIEYCGSKRYDACYIRYDFSDAGFISLLKRLSKVCNNIVIELPTYPYEEENKNGVLSKIKLLIDKHYRMQLYHYVRSFVTFYDGYSTLFGIPVIVVPNGFDFSTMQLVTQELEKDVVHVIAVSSMREWHGYERFLAGMRDYYIHGGDKNLILHLVGNGRECSKYKALAEEYSLGAHVVFEGAMHGEALDAVYEKCAVGIDSLARHRSGIDVLSSLKSREYGAKGIPIINSCKIDILDADFPYLLRVPADESPINIADVLEFCQTCYEGKNRIEVGKEIRKYIEERSGMKQTLKKVVELFEMGCSMPY
nr:hypothetical protein [Clostridia bacterium]